MTVITQNNHFNHIKSIVLKVMIMALLTSPLFVKAESVSLGYFTLAPHIFQDKDGNAVGPLPEFLNKHIGPAMGVTFKLVNMPLARILKEMERGELPGGALFGCTQDRTVTYNYPVHSFYSMQPVIAVLKSSPLDEISLPANLKKLSIGYVTDAIISLYMKNNQIEFLNLSGNNTWQRNVKMLLEGRLDAVYSPAEINMMHAANNVNVLDKIKIIRLPEAPNKLYSLFSNDKAFDKLNLATKYDKAFKQVNGAHVYKSLLSHWEGKLISEKIFKSKVE